MIKRKTMSNLEIFNTATALIEAFQKESEETHFPVKVNFFLQKNMTSIIEMAQELEKSRTEIIKKFGEPTEGDENKVSIPPEKVDEATKELEDLFDLEQEVPVNMLELDWFDGIDMTAQQVSAIAYMINENEE